MSAVPYKELAAAERIGERQFSQATRVCALWTKGEIAVEVWHGKSACTYKPTRGQIADEIAGVVPANVPAPAQVRCGR